MSIYRRIGKILKMGTLVSTLGLIATVSLQIFARFFLASAPSWTEEASRLFFIYAISFASGIALKNNSYVGLDMFYNMFSARIRKVLDLLIPTLIFALFGVVMVYAIQFVFIGNTERSPSMGIRMSLAFSSIFIMSITICFYASIKIKSAVKNLKK
jgi:TRAP-type C4-dicarboxylate transport system permease small subunit|tara:strand:- start:9249 stop:9716 length:468 start_codon:yes stop_codon:yes gene_type:complete